MKITTLALALSYSAISMAVETKTDGQPGAAVQPEVPGKVEAAGPGVAAGAWKGEGGPEGPGIVVTDNQNIVGDLSAGGKDQPKGIVVDDNKISPIGADKQSSPAKDVASKDKKEPADVKDLKKPVDAKDAKKLADAGGAIPKPPTALQEPAAPQPPVAPQDPAAPQDVALVVKGAAGAKAEVKGSLELMSTAEGASYFYVKPEGSPRVFSLKDGMASVEQNGAPSVVGHVKAYGGVSLLAAGKAEANAVAKQALEFDAQGMVTNVKFYVSASATVGIAADGKIPADCQPIEVFKAPVGEASASAAAHAGASAGANANANAAASANANAGIAGPGWNNGTMKTVKDYTTYCPEATTITLSTCIQETCAPHTVTVTGETTVTITGDCLVPETKAPHASASAKAEASASASVKANAKAPVAPKDTAAQKNSTSASRTQTTAPQISTFNGATRNAVGIAGIAGVLAMLI